MDLLNNVLLSIIFIIFDKQKSQKISNITDMVSQFVYYNFKIIYYSIIPCYYEITLIKSLNFVIAMSETIEAVMLPDKAIQQLIKSSIHIPT